MKRGKRKEAKNFAEKRERETKGEKSHKREMIVKREEKDRGGQENC